jgi:hypothetical protein
MMARAATRVRSRLVVVGVLLSAPAPAAACDICAVYTATELREAKVGFRAGVAEQFTYYGTLQRDGEEIPNPAGEFLRSSITQVVLGYNFHPRAGVQVNLPVISRTFRRVEASGVERGDETGPGDLSILGNLLAFDHMTDRSVLRFTLVGGLKLPSGDSSRLGEEAGEDEAGGAAASPHPALAHVVGGGAESGVHGHDLALGSGSVDGVVGGSLFWSWRRAFVTATGQYAIRGEGDFDYRYANDLTWVGGPGVFAVLTHDWTITVQGLFGGETKGKDEIDGVAADDTGITTLFAGPGFALTWGTSLHAELAADLPVVRNNTAVQIVPDYRLRGAVTWRF